tara:strand:- start:1768 stop:1977 length:210 start_codon:yes stop_codon:yes gene_type:complete
MNMSDSDQSLAAQIIELRKKHRMLDGEILQLLDQPYVDQLQLQRLKRQKLRIKDTIKHLEDMQIDDLDA